VTLWGCATRVPQVLEPTLVPQSFVGQDLPSEQVWPTPDWWRQFGSPELSEFIAKARTDNRDLAVAAARVMEAHSQTIIQRAALFPQLNLQAQAERASLSSTQSGNFQNSIVGSSFGLTLGASYEVDIWGLARSNLRAAQETLKSARFAQQSVALTLTAEVADTYFSVLALRKRIDIANEDIAAINTILATIELRVSTGKSSHLDLAQERAQVESVEAELPVLQEQELEARLTLGVLLGQPPERLEVKTAGPEGIRLPLSGSDGFASAAIASLLHGPSVAWDYGGNLLQTVFDGGALVGKKKLAAATQQELIASYQGAVLNAYADVESALGQVKNNVKAEGHLEREVDAAREAFQISQLQYRQGTTDLLTVLQSQQTLFAAEDQLAQTALARMQALVHLYEALGGGWVEPPQERTQFFSSP
jgi:multidrug efflux system outer membrane protein